jgi:hypothetical protein
LLAAGPSGRPPGDPGASSAGARGGVLGLTRKPVPKPPNRSGPDDPSQPPSDSDGLAGRKQPHSSMRYLFIHMRYLFIHSSAWKCNSPKFGCRILHSTGPMTKDFLRLDLRCCWRGRHLAPRPRDLARWRCRRSTYF